MILRVRPFQKSIKDDPVPLQVMVRGSKSARERLLPAFFEFYIFLVDFGTPWGAQKSQIFMINGCHRTPGHTFFANLGSLGSLWGNFWSLGPILNDF